MNADEIISKIVEDIKSRMGLGDTWDEIDVDTRNEIVAGWRKFFPSPEEAQWQERFRARVGDSLEVLDAIREALNDGPKEQILELVNGYIDRARKDLK